MSGFVKLHREAISGWMWDLAPKQTKVCLTLIAMANWKEGTTFSGGEFVKIQRGQIMTSTPSIAKAAKVSIQTVRTTLKLLEKCDFLTRKSTAKFSIITILNYREYQDKDSDVQHSNQQLTNSLATAQQQLTNSSLTTIEEGKKGRREEGKKNNILVGDESPTPKPSNPKLVTESALKAAGYLRDRILEQNPNCSASRNWGRAKCSWGQELDKLHRIDGKAWPEIRSAIDWLHDSDNTFVVLSAKKLRKSWDSIEANRRKSKQPNGISQDQFKALSENQELE